jgi:hypothetical protein
MPSTMIKSTRTDLLWPHEFQVAGDSSSAPKSMARPSNALEIGQLA